MHIAVSRRLGEDGRVAQNTVVQCTLCLKKLQSTVIILQLHKDVIITVISYSP